MLTPRNSLAGVGQARRPEPSGSAACRSGRWRSPVGRGRASIRRESPIVASSMLTGSAFRPRPGTGLVGDLATALVSRLTAHWNAPSASSAVVSSTTASAACTHVRRIARVARPHLGLDGGRIGGNPLGLQFQPAPACPFGQRRRDVQLHRRIGKDHRADVAAVQHRAALGREAALEIQQCGAHRRDRRHGGGGGIGHRSAQIAALQIVRPQRPRRRRRRRPDRRDRRRRPAPAGRRRGTAGRYRDRAARASRRSAAPACPCPPRRDRRWR